jgi:hypothetical protein
MSCPFRSLLVGLLVAPGALAFAQAPARDSVAPLPLLIVGSTAEERHRVAQLRGQASSAGSMLRSASAMSDTTPLSWSAVRVNAIAPYGAVTWNSRLPFSLNDGSQWAGRGLTVMLAGGVVARAGRLSVNLIPLVWRTENRPSEVLPGVDPQRKSFASPWHVGSLSADLPLRFGYRSTTALDLGESAVWITARGTAVGLSTESQWWGPGQRNALILSNNAGGFPHLFVRTATPLRTRVGAFEGRWLIGGLSESRFFDWQSENDLRSLSGAAVTFTPAVEPNFTAGASRVVYANVGGVGGLTGTAFDVLTHWSARSGDTLASADQLTSLFGRWIFPRQGAEVYGEWARMILPTSLRALLVAPQFSQGFTVGVQWITPRAARSAYRLQLEFTNLEQSPDTRVGDTVAFYTSSDVPQGYTQRGQVIGAAIGPGSSSQWFAVDRLTDSFDVGAFVGRIRWDTDAYYLQPTSVYYFSYDASIFAGTRANVRRGAREMAAELWAQYRFNHLFQNANEGWSESSAFDRSNFTLRVRFY